MKAILLQTLLPSLPKMTRIEQWPSTIIHGLKTIGSFISVNQIQLHFFADLLKDGQGLDFNWLSTH